MVSSIEMMNDVILYLGTRSYSLQGVGGSIIPKRIVITIQFVFEGLA